MDTLDVLWLISLLEDRRGALSEADCLWLDTVHEEMTEGRLSSLLPAELVHLKACCATVGIGWVAAWDGYPG